MDIFDAIDTLESKIRSTPHGDKLFTKHEKALGTLIGGSAIMTIPAGIFIEKSTQLGGYLIDTSKNIYDKGRAAYQHYQTDKPY